MMKQIFLSLVLAVALSACQSNSVEKKQGLAADIELVNTQQAAQTQTAAPKNLSTTQLIEHNIEKNSQLRVDRIEETPIEGLYAVFLKTGETVYSSADGMHFVAGDLYGLRTDVKGMNNLTEKFREEKRAKELASIDEKDTIAFKADGKKKGHIYVFTDVDCYYCQKLHKEVPALNKAGVEVRYLGFPRAGLKSPAFEKIQSAWCASDQQEAMTKLKARQFVEKNICDSKAVAQQFMLGRRIGVRGTPAIMTESGQLISGYMPAKQLVEAIGIN